MRASAEMRSKLWALALLALLALPTNAITWGEDQVRDPISGRRIKVPQPASWGDYIYTWDSKSDQVFWPYTDPLWLWFSKRSGYIAFGDDFLELSDDERTRLTDWLKSHYDRKARPKSRLELLLWAEKVYAQRAMDDAFWSRFYRLLAFETREDPTLSLPYVERAMPLLEQQLQLETPAEQLEALYLLGEYSRRLGLEEAAADYFQRLSDFPADEDHEYFKSYLLAIAAERGAAP